MILTFNWAQILLSESHTTCQLCKSLCLFSFLMTDLAVHNEMWHILGLSGPNHYHRHVVDFFYQPHFYRSSQVFLLFLNFDRHRC